MLGSSLRLHRLPLAAAAAAALVASLATATSADGRPAAAPAVPGARPATPVKASNVDLNGRSTQTSLPRSMGGTPRSTGEPGGTGTAASLPSKGNYAFLLELTASSTWRAYQVARPRGAAAASQAARAQLSAVTTAQNAVIAALPAGSRVLYRAHSVLAGLAVITDVHNVGRLGAISGVSAVHPIAPKTMANSYAVPLQHAPEAWTAYGQLGQQTTIAVIDTGIDFTHANFGGPGTTAAYNTAFASDSAAADPALFPSAKIVGGTDLAGDAYNADDPANSTPAPDPNPLDCNGHGSHVAGTAAGYGVDSGGATFAGPYNSGTPFGSLRIGPGMAPAARIIAFKVFGCDGSSDVVGQAIDLAGDPNGDGDPADHADVINMSLGSDFGSPVDGDAVASDAASAAGITVVAASGNGGDVYDVGGSPANAPRAIAVANSVDALSMIDHVHVSAPAGIVGDYGATRSVAYNWGVDPDLSGPVVALLDPTNKDGCNPYSPADLAEVNRKVVFLEWTDDDAVRRCGSVPRGVNAANAGAAGFILADDAETLSAGITGSATIPGVLVIKSAGDAIRAALGDGVNVTGTGASDFAQVITADNDKVNSSSSRGVHGAGNVKPDVTAVGTSVFSTAVGTGNEGTSLSGTSMATPMVAGLAALVRGKHPDWTPAEVKADIMNTAGQDLFVGDNHSGAKYSPNRVGAGRIDAKAALDNSVVAYALDTPGTVSVSFGPVAVTGATTVAKTIKVTNKGLDAASYTTSYVASSTVPGVSFVVSPATVTVAGRSSALVTVTFTVTDATLLAKSIDPSMSRTEGGLPRNYLADASGRVVLAPVSGSAPALRVPVYAAPRPASVMTQPTSITMPLGAVQNAAVPLSGQGVSQGAGDEAVQSIVAGFELQATSGLVPACSPQTPLHCVSTPDDRAADLRYVATTSDAPQQVTPMNGLAYFAISTHGPWRTEATTTEFDVWIDSTGDGEPDAILFNTRLNGQDVFVSKLIDLNSGDTLDIEAINDELGNVDTAEFDSDTIVMPVAINTLPGIGTGHGRIKYGVVSWGSSTEFIDIVGLNAVGDFVNPLSFDVLQPGILVSVNNNGILYQDMPNTSLTLRRDKAMYGADKAIGALFVHFHNRVGTKAQVVALKSPGVVTLQLSTRTVRHVGTVMATVTVANNAGPVPTGVISLRYCMPGQYVRSILRAGGGVRFLLTYKRAATCHLRAYYSGDANYLPGSSPYVTLTVL